jgi:hypothetical protein
MKVLRRSNLDPETFEYRQRPVLSATISPISEKLHRTGNKLPA